MYTVALCQLCNKDVYDMMMGILLPQLAPSGHPACNGDPASIGTVTWTPGFYWRPGLLLETRLLY